MTRACQRVDSSRLCFACRPSLPRAVKKVGGMMYSKIGNVCWFCDDRVLSAGDFAVVDFVCGVLKQGWLDVLIYSKIGNVCCFCNDRVLSAGDFTVVAFVCRGLEQVQYDFMVLIYSKIESFVGVGGDGVLSVWLLLKESYAYFYWLNEAIITRRPIKINPITNTLFPILL